MKVLITGGAGTVGYHTIRALLDSKHDITAIELKTKNNIKRLKKFKDKINIIWGA